MPSSATITTFYTFVANSKARASQVNLNFSLWRGHVIPIHPDTATSADNSYDLGSSEYYWRNLYVGEVDLRTSTSTASLRLKGDTSATAGAFVFEIEGQEVARIGPNGFGGGDLAPNSVTIGALFSRYTSATATASDGGVAIRSFTQSTVTAQTNISGSTITVTGIGRPMIVGISGNVNMGVNIATAGGWEITAVIELMKDGSSMKSWTYKLDSEDSSGGSGQDAQNPITVSHLFFPTAGAHNYHLRVTPSTDGIGNTPFLNMPTTDIYAYEI